jgi:periplasmic divalent cation tolerance protein
MYVVLCNCPPADAERIARVLVEERLAACVNLTPVKSVYPWDGKLCVEEEVTLVIKVSSDGAEALRLRLRALHPYDVPEILALPVDVQHSHPQYVEWVRRGG